MPRALRSGVRANSDEVEMDLIMGKSSYVKLTQEQRMTGEQRAERAKAKRKATALTALAKEGFKLRWYWKRGNLEATGRLMRLIRDTLSISRAELADRWYRHPETIQVWENGHIREGGKGKQMINDFIREHFDEAMNMTKGV